MAWQPTQNWQKAKQRAKVLAQIRAFFAERNVIEVETPALSQGTVTDVHLDAMTCRYNFLSDSSQENAVCLYLQTSPEYHMKRLLASGYGCIYQMSKAFRHEESGRFHNPEFTMLEWYRIGFDDKALMKEVADLLHAVLACEEPSFISYQNVFIQFTELDPLITSKTALLALIARYDLLSDWLEEEQDIDILLQFVFSEIIEPNIGQSAPCFIYDFPRSQASLAKINEHDPRVAKRFECYYRGVELVNGFDELTDLSEQKHRFDRDNIQRVKNGLALRPIDQNFLHALEKGLPDCAGVALGVDRLVMLALNAKHIDEVMSFPIARA